MLAYVNAKNHIGLFPEEQPERVVWSHIRWDRARDATQVNVPAAVDSPLLGAVAHRDVSLVDLSELVCLVLCFGNVSVFERHRVTP